MGGTFLQVQFLACSSLAYMGCVRHKGIDITATKEVSRTILTEWE